MNDENGILKIQTVKHATFWHTAYFMSKNYGHKSYKYLQKWQNLTKNNLELQWSSWFYLDKIVYLSTLKSEASKSNRTGYLL